MNARGHLSSQTLDLLALSSLAAQEGAQAQLHLERCGACKRRWDELSEDRARFGQFVFPRSLPNVEVKAARSSWRSVLRRRWWAGMPIVGAAAVALAALVVLGPPPPDEPTYLLKGGARFEVVARQGARQLTVGADTVLEPGDLIRFLVDPAGAPYLLLASRDGAGEVTIYYPFDGQHSGAAQMGRGELPGSIELDGTSGREHLYAIFSESPVAAGAVRETLLAGGDPVALPGVREVVVRSFVKAAR